MDFFITTTSRSLILVVGVQLFAPDEDTVNVSVSVPCPADSAEVVETAFCTFVLSRIAGEIASILDGIPLSVQRRFPELENRHVDFLKRDIIKAMNKAAALDELIPGLLSEYIEQSG